MKLNPELKRKVFLQLLKNEHIPAPKLEYVFCTERKFAADYFWDCNGVRLMLELQGGVEDMKISRHTSILGGVEDTKISRHTSILGGVDGVKISGHTSILGMKRDREKLNLASSHHIFTMQVSYRELTLPITIKQIKQILKLN